MQQDIATKDTNNLQKKANYYDLFWMFVFGSVAGFILEGVWSTWRFGAWANHAATVWGPFCIIYGAGMVAIYLIAQKLARFNTLVKFLLFCLGGALLELACGILQNLIFGSRSWDYGGAFYGFINLEMTIIWGLLGVVFSWLVLPLSNRFIGKFNSKFWRRAGILLTIFLLIDFSVTSMAVWRWGDRLNGIEARNKTEEMLDLSFDNARMSEIFPNMEFRKLGE